MTCSEANLPTLAKYCWLHDIKIPLMTAESQRGDVDRYEEEFVSGTCHRQVARVVILMMMMLMTMRKR